MATRAKLTRTDLGAGNRVMRLVWTVVWALFYRPSPNFLFGWRIFLLRIFGATIEAGAHPYSSAKIWAPWNLTMKKGSCLGPHVDCYDVAPITLGEDSVVSQYSYLCSASHDYRYARLPLIAAPIVVERRAWVTACVFVGPGVTVGEGAVVLARSSVFSDIPPWKVARGSPAEVWKDRSLLDE